jgi:hypothetical protein
MARKRSKHYISQELLGNEIRHFHSTGEITNELGDMLIKIARRFASKPNFSSYSYKEEFISFAIEQMLSILPKVNPDHNPFSFLTQNSYWSFIKIIKREKKYQQLKNNYKEMCFDKMVNNENITENNNTIDFDLLNPELMTYEN